MGLFGVSKLVVGLLADFSVSKIIGFAVRKVTPKEMSKATSLIVRFGTFIIALIAGSYASKFVQQQMDETRDAIIGTKEALTEAREKLSENQTEEVPETA